MLREIAQAAMDVLAVMVLTFFVIFAIGSVPLAVFLMFFAVG